MVCFDTSFVGQIGAKFRAVRHGCVMLCVMPCVMPCVMLLGARCYNGGVHLSRGEACMAYVSRPATSCGQTKFRTMVYVPEWFYA